MIIQTRAEQHGCLVASIASLFTENLAGVLDGKESGTTAGKINSNSVPHKMPSKHASRQKHGKLNSSLNSAALNSHP